MTKATMLRWLYRLLINISLPFAVLRLLWKSRKDPAYRQRLTERLAWHLPNSQASIWIHTVSVGELIATLPLIEQLLDSGENLLITTTTPTGSAMVQEKLAQRVNHCYLPFDTRWIMRRFIRQTQPRMAVFVETEIWANTLHVLKTNAIPALLINARLSEKSFDGYAKLGVFAQETLANFTEIACQNLASQTRFQALGGHATLLGNIKFDLRPPADLVEKQRVLTEKIGNRPFIIAASTHKGEEEILFQALANSQESRLFVIAPRHPERSESILRLAQQLNLSAARYTAVHSLSPDAQVLIVDTLGQLLTFYSLSDYAIIGGSFIPRGGHNPLEAALFSIPCVIGPHTFNFDSLIDEMQSENAINRITAKQLFQQPKAIVGENAKRFLAANQGALQRYVHLVQSFL